MTDITFPPPPFGWVSTLPETIPGANIAAALVNDDSRARAALIYSHQQLSDQATNLLANEIEKLKLKRLPPEEHLRATINLFTQFMRTHPPDQYVIPYYTVADRNEPVVEMFERVFGRSETIFHPDGKIEEKVTAHFREGNPIEPPNGNMERAIQEAFAAIQSQLPERYKFVRTDKPSEALLSFASILKGEAIDGVQNSGLILFPTSSFSGKYTSAMAYMALHEIGHGLGLQHPQNHQKIRSSYSVDKVSFLDSAMTYKEENDKSVHGTVNFPITLMPSDLVALTELQRIKSDEAGLPRIATHSGIVLSPTAVRLSQKDASRAVQMPQMGVMFDIAYDSPRDVLSVFGKKSLDITQEAHGVVISRSDRQATTLLPVHAENVVLNTEGHLNFYTAGNVTVDIPSSGDHSGGLAWVWIKGEKNQVSLSAAQFLTKTPSASVALFPGSELSLNIKNADELLADDSRSRLNFPVMPVYNSKDTSKEHIRITWGKTETGYTLEVKDTTGKHPSSRVAITLDSNDPMVRSRFEVMLNQNVSVIMHPGIEKLSTHRLDDNTIPGTDYSNIVLPPTPSKTPNSTPLR